MDCSSRFLPLIESLRIPGHVAIRALIVRYMSFQFHHAVSSKLLPMGAPTGESGATRCTCPLGITITSLLRHLAVGKFRHPTAQVLIKHEVYHACSNSHVIWA